jgi:2-haloacid dehalogenase
MLDFSRISALTFDCYGTLVDWETGILGAVRGVCLAHAVKTPEDGQLISLYAELEMQAEAGGYRPYREVLASVLEQMARRCGVRSLLEGERDALAESLPRWPVFADTPEFLRRARGRYALAICSNIDDDLFEGTRPKLGAPIDHVITAQFCGSYKPRVRHFHEALKRLGLPAERVLHVAESRRHDIEPASRLGFRTVWVNRHQSRGGASASGVGEGVADLEVGSLAELGEVMGLAVEASHGAR